MEFANREEDRFIRRIIGEHFGREAARGFLLPLKSGMTNDSFLFTAHGKKYIFRCNGKGTEHLIDRENEKRVYELLRSTGITERVAALSIDPGYKISRYYECSHVCDPQNADEVDACMRALRAFHARRMTGAKRFDPFDMVAFYEKMMPYETLASSEYCAVRAAVFALRPFLAPFLNDNPILCHIDAISDNFLFVEGRDHPYLIDWEYAGLSDPLIDLAMFAIYANYTEEETHRLLESYFLDGFDDRIKARVYGYMAVGGLLWSCWCAYKTSLGTAFGTYAAHQIAFAKDYPSKVRALIGDI